MACSHDGKLVFKENKTKTYLPKIQDRAEVGNVNPEQFQEVRPQWNRKLSCMLLGTSTGTAMDKGNTA